MELDIIRRRFKGIRKQLRDRGIDCLIVQVCENVRFLTGFTGHDSWLLVSGRNVTLITDSRYTEQAERECVGCSIIERSGPISEELAKYLGCRKSIRTVGVEMQCTLATLKNIKKQVKLRIKPVGGIVESVRSIKEPYELRNIRKACRLSWKALSLSIGRFKPGMTENQCTAILEYEMRMLGSVPSFETILAFGPNGSINHHQPGNRKLRKNDTILLDFGAMWDGYHSDITRSFAYGKPVKLFEKVYYAVAEAQKAAIETIRDGVDLEEVDQTAREIIRNKGLEPYKHGTGHGLGLHVHEEPSLSVISRGKLREGMVVTVEPGVYLPGKFGVRIEDDVLVRKDGFEIVSVDKEFGFSGDEMIVL